MASILWVIWSLRTWVLRIRLEMDSDEVTACRDGSLSSRIVYGCRLNVMTHVEFPTITQRVQVPNFQGFWSQKPFRAFLGGPESLNIGYLDPLG